MNVAAVLALCLMTTVHAHSWIEELMVIAQNGTFTGTPGYPRGNVLRTSPAYSDTAMTYLNPPDGGATLAGASYMCKDSQRTRNQTDGSPALQASAGAAIALRYQENGHVTLPWNQPGKPENRGTVYVYGTTQPKEDEMLVDVHKVWNKDGTGGDKRGVLLTKQNFDDGHCYQVNPSNISDHRQKVFKHDNDPLMGPNLWCQTDVGLPSNAPSGKPYTLYWVWDWPTAPGVDPSLPKGKQEIYSTCIDIDVTSSQVSRVGMQPGYAKGQSLNSAAIPEQFAEIYGSSQSSGSAKSSPASSSSSSQPSPYSIESSFASSTPLVPSKKLTGPTNIPSPSFITLTKTVTASSCHQT